MTQFYLCRPEGARISRGLVAIQSSGTENPPLLGMCGENISLLVPWNAKCTFGGDCPIGKSNLQTLNELGSKTPIQIGKASIKRI